MHLRSGILITSILIFGIIGNARTEQIKKVGQTSMKWLSIPIGARATGMGTAYFCMSGSVDNILWNPAGVSYLESHEISISHLSWIADINQSAGLIGLVFGNIGVFTISIRYLDFGEINGTRLSSSAQGWEYTEVFNPSSYQVGFGYSNKMSESFSYGIHLSYAAENLGTIEYAPVVGGSAGDPIQESSSLSIINMDFGVLYYTGFHDLRIGMTLKNFSQEKGYGNVDSPVPMDLRLGMAMDIFNFFMEESRDHDLTFAFDLSHPRDYSERLHFGLEYVYNKLFALRMGYKSNYDEENIAFGAGILPNFSIGGIKFGLDYAFVPFGIFDSVQTFSFTIRF